MAAKARATNNGKNNNTHAHSRQCAGQFYPEYVTAVLKHNTHAYTLTHTYVRNTLHGMGNSPSLLFSLQPIATVEGNIFHTFDFWLLAAQHTPLATGYTRMGLYLPAAAARAALHAHTDEHGRTTGVSVTCFSLSLSLPSLSLVSVGVMATTLPLQLHFQSWQLAVPARSASHLFITSRYGREQATPSYVQHTVGENTMHASVSAMVPGSCTKTDYCLFSASEIRRKNLPKHTRRARHLPSKSTQIAEWLWACWQLPLRSGSLPQVALLGGAVFDVCVAFATQRAKSAHGEGRAILCGADFTKKYAQPCDEA